MSHSVNKSPRLLQRNLQLTSTNWPHFTALSTSGLSTGASLQIPSPSVSWAYKCVQFGGLGEFVPHSPRPHSLWRTVHTSVVTTCTTCVLREQVPYEHTPYTPFLHSCVLYGRGGTPLQATPQATTPMSPCQVMLGSMRGASPPYPLLGFSTRLSKLSLARACDLLSFWHDCNLSCTAELRSSAQLCMLCSSSPHLSSISFLDAYEVCPVGACSSVCHHMSQLGA